MSRCRFVQPEVVRLYLSDGDWLGVKKRLSVGEERAAFQAIVGEVNPSGWRKPNVEMLGIAEMFAYIVEWSFRDAQDRAVPVSIESIKQLDSETFKEIEKALEGHVATIERALEKEKNARDGAIELVPISPSAA
jgi:hypothetical protein